MKKNKKPVASLHQINNTFESLLQDFPSDLIESAKEFEAFRSGRKAKKNGITVKKGTLEYAEWTMIVTSLEQPQIRAEEIGKMYRLRWQIEMVIKRLKSVLEIDKLRSKIGGKISEVYL